MKLLSGMISLARGDGFHVMVLQTDSRMSQAIALYEKLGFKNGVKKRQTDGAVYYMKLLDSAPQGLAEQTKNPNLSCSNRKDQGFDWGLDRGA